MIVVIAVSFLSTSPHKDVSSMLLRSSSSFFHSLVAMVLGYLIFCFLVHVVRWAVVLEAPPLVTEVEESIGDDCNSRRGSGDSSLLLLLVWLTDCMVLACMVSVSERVSILWCWSWLKFSVVSPTVVTFVGWICFPGCPHCVLDWWMRNPPRFLHTFPQWQVASAVSPVKAWVVNP